MAWKLGLKLPPPHFLGFFPLALGAALWFGTLWGLAMWFLLCASQGWWFSATAAIMAGSFFGLFLAAYYRHSARKFDLPMWNDYPKPQHLDEFDLGTDTGISRVVPDTE